MIKLGQNNDYMRHCEKKFKTSSKEYNPKILRIFIIIFISNKKNANHTKNKSFLF